MLQTLTAAGVHDVAMYGSSLFERLPDPVRAAVAADDVKLLACRRTTLEWVLRRSVLVEPGVELRVGLGVDGLVAEQPDGGVPTITGVRFEDGSTVDADLVVASSGRRSTLPAWLDAVGVAVRETSNDAGLVYFSRFYRSEQPNTFGFRAWLSGGLGGGVIGADAGTYSITIVVNQHDRALRTHLGDNDRFEASIRLMPDLADVVAHGGEPIHPVHLMTGLINRIRKYTDDAGNPVAEGVLAIGDAHTCTNPAYGRGASLALLQAILAADAVAASDDLLTAARRYEAASRERVEPWYHMAALADRPRPRGGSNTADRPSSPAGSSGLDLSALMGAASNDPELFHRLMRVFNLLESPQALFARLPRMQRTIAGDAEVRSSSGSDRPRRRRITREEILAVG